MYDELIKRLHRYSENCVAYKLDADFADAVQQAADTIEKLDMKLHGANAAIAGMQREIERMVIDSANGKPQWIPVAERLPEPYEEVFVYLWKTQPYLASRDVTGEWSTSDFVLDVEDIPTHWMPLPEPPKGE